MVMNLYHQLLHSIPLRVRDKFILTLASVLFMSKLNILVDDESCVFLLTGHAWYLWEKRKTWRCGGFLLMMCDYKDITIRNAHLWQN